MHIDSNLPYTWDIWEEIDKQFDPSKNIYLTVIDMRNQYSWTVVVS